MTSCLFSCQLSGEKIASKLFCLSSEKRSTLKQKTLLPWEANSFILEQTSFQKEAKGKTILMQLSPLKVYQFPLNGTVLGCDHICKLGGLLVCALDLQAEGHGFKSCSGQKNFQTISTSSSY